MLRPLASLLGVTACILLVIVWLTSIWFSFSVGARLGGSTLCFMIRSGSVTMLDVTSPDPTNSLSIAPQLQQQDPEPEVWLPHVSRGDPFGVAYTIVILPLWIPLVLIALPSGFFYICQRRATRPGVCSHCSYSLTGLAPNSPCPECGAPFKSSTT